jgi:YD repeat-containing protein
VTRTTTTTYDAAGRKTGSAVTVSPSGSDGTATPSQTFGYDSSTGLPTTTTDLSNSKVVTTGYDNLGRVISYTDATGAVTTTTYDLDGRVASVTDPNASTTYVYDGTSGEHRGVVTSSIDSLAGAFAGTYDSDGHLLTQTYPGGLTATYSYDNSGAPVETLYSEAGVTWLNFTASRDTQGRIAASNNAAGTTTGYVYDNAGRLTAATDNTSSACNVRAYGFNNNSDRTSLAISTYSPTAGACTGSGTPTTVTHSYDQADRITDTGYSYDDFGRTLGVPSVDAGGNGALTIGYYTNDLVHDHNVRPGPCAAGADPNHPRDHHQRTGRPDRGERDRRESVRDCVVERRLERRVAYHRLHRHLQPRLVYGHHHRRDHRDRDRADQWHRVHVHRDRHQRDRHQPVLRGIERGDPGV